MKSVTTERFRTSLGELPAAIRRQAREAYLIFQNNPRHPSLRFKRIHPTLPIYAVRIGVHYRAVGVHEGDTLIWFWIGSHADYDRLISHLE